MLITVPLTPLQAAGEEHGLRGLIIRVTGGWTRGSRAGLVLGSVVSSVVFTAAHGSADPYVLARHLSLAESFAVLTWRTGGLEMAVVLHAVLNVMAFLMSTALRVDVAGAFADRSVAGTRSSSCPPSSSRWSPRWSGGAAGRQVRRSRRADPPTRRVAVCRRTPRRRPRRPGRRRGRLPRRHRRRRRELTPRLRPAPAGGRPHRASPRAPARGRRRGDVLAAHTLREVLDHRDDT
ncbi:CPBP family intramembrane glutamic endopeptidase [uncultured Pseudokineococcus sp.]|uniref:CPBP family intramembrane glutamic endopeptidase n=1 Tax=uncultured Pseudokineococcus sp. TaxID=1642928 RepID=UPI003440634A